MPAGEQQAGHGRPAAPSPTGELLRASCVSDVFFQMALIICVDFFKIVISLKISATLQI